MSINKEKWIKPLLTVHKPSDISNIKKPGKELEEKYLKLPDVMNKTDFIKNNTPNKND